VTLQEVFMLLWFLIPLATAAAPDVLFPVWPGDGDDHASIALTVPAVEIPALLAQRSKVGIDVNSDGGPYTRWDLSAKEVGGVAVGSQWAMLAQGSRTECTVESFHMITAGRPDEPLRESTSSGAPCGSPLVYARTTCTGIYPSLVVPIRNTTATIGTELRQPDPPAFGDLKGIDAIRAGVVAEAGERRVKGEVYQVVYQVGNTEVTVTEGRFFTGNGESECGGEDLSTSWVGVSGGEHRPEAHVGRGSILTVLDLQGDGSIETIESGSVLRDANGEVLFSLNTDWCVCGC
jgi:hypothetical protein